MNLLNSFPFQRCITSQLFHTAESQLLKQFWYALYFDDRIITPATECTSPIRIQFGRSTSVATASIPHDTPLLVYVHKLCMRVYASWLPVAHSCPGLSDGQRHEDSPRGRFVWMIACHYGTSRTAKDTLPSDRYSESIAITISHCSWIKRHIY